MAGSTLEKLRKDYTDDCALMVRHAMRSGVKLDSRALQRFEEIMRSPDGVGGRSLQELSELHAYLLESVDPATPRSIHHAESTEKAGAAKNPMLTIPLVRRLMVFSGVCLVALIALSLSTHVNGDPKNFNLFASSGWPLLLNQLFLLSAAGLGAAFAALFKANSFIESGAFDPRYETSYWMHVILGLVAGTILAMLIPIEQIEMITHATAGDMHTSTLNGFGKPLLAIAGGFSATLVYKSLVKIVGFLETLIDTLVPTPGQALRRARNSERKELGYHPGMTASVASPRPSNTPPKAPSPKPAPQAIEIQKGSRSSAGQSPGGFELVLQRFVELGEGRRSAVYKDSLGIPTIGIGCNLQSGSNKLLIESMNISVTELLQGQRELTDTEIEQIFEHQIEECRAGVTELFQNFHNLEPARQIVLLDMFFNLGQNRLSRFRKFRKAVEAYEFETAGLEMQNSRWYEQVGQRGQRNVYLMTHGTAQGAPHLSEALLKEFEQLENSSNHRAA